MKIENGYVTTISYEMKTEATDTTTGYKGKMTITLSDFGKATVEIPEAIASSEAEKAA